MVPSQLLLFLLLIYTLDGAIPAVSQPTELGGQLEQRNPTPNGRSCYGCIGWCTYGDECRPPINVKWHDMDADLGTHGRAWPLSEMGGQPYARFPAHAQHIVDKTVWSISRRSAGIKTRFSSTATDLWVRWHPETVAGDWLWPATGHSGIDIYIDDDNGPRWATSSGNNPFMHTQDNAANGLVSGLFNIPPRVDGLPRNFTVYLPLGQATANVSIATMSAHSQDNVPVLPVPPAVNASLPPSGRPVLWYGTSIMNGAAANRPGMGYPQQAERMLGMSGYNIGFGGNGKMQPYYAESGLLSEINASIMVIDCEYNMAGMDPLLIYNLTIDFITAQRQRRPDIPILLLEGHPHGLAWISESLRTIHNVTKEAYRRAYNTLLRRGIREVYFSHGDLKLGGSVDTDFRAQSSTVAGVHPSPLGLRELARFASDRIIEIFEGRASDNTPQPTGGLWPPTTTILDSGLPAMNGIDEDDWWLRAAGWDHLEATSSNNPTLVWTDAQLLTVEGKGWDSNSSKQFWQRLPDSAIDVVPRGIWQLSRQTSGILVRFSTNSTTVGIAIERADYVPNTDDIFTTNGKYGFDVHIQDIKTGAWRWGGTEAATSAHANGSLVLSGLPPGPLNFTVYLPTYSPVQSFQIGVLSGTSLNPHQLYPKSEPAIAIWGSSIAQGGVVENAGMTWPMQVQRILDLPVLNFGFSGSCEMQESVASVIGSLPIKPRMLVLDCLPNMQQDTPTAVRNATVAVLQQLRTDLGPTVPILVLEGHQYTSNWIKPAQAANEKELCKAQHDAVLSLQPAVPNLYYATSEQKLGNDSVIASESCGGMGVHPTGLAHLAIGQFVSEKIAEILGIAKE